jgi:hypothetical protein
MFRDGLPSSVLYATSARIGGIGLDLVALETILGIEPYLGKAISYGVRAPDIDRSKMKTLRFHPVRLLSNLERKYYYAAKKRAASRVAAQFLKTCRFDLFHAWEGDALEGLRVAKSLGIPSLLEIPTWHRQKGNILPPKTEQEIAMDNAPIPRRWLNRLLILRQDTLEEQELADLLLVESEKAAESFRTLGFPSEKLYSMPQGADVNRFQPGPPSPLFRVVFVGALIRQTTLMLWCAPFDSSTTAPTWFEAMARRAGERVVQQFTWNHFRKRVLDAYRLAMARVSASRPPNLVT